MRTRSWLVFALSIGVAGLVYAARPMALTNGDPAPPMRGNLPNGDLLIVDYSPTELTLINFWATWCEPCRKEMPALDDLYRRHAGAGLQVIGVHVGPLTDDEYAQFKEAVPVDYPLILNPSARWLSPWGGLSILPRSYLVASDGRILRGYVGASAEQVEALVYDVEAVLDGRPLGPVVVPTEPSDVSTPEDRDRAKDETE
ncbi:MAG TPA: redoxin domain-containing protein [Candidatus Polarisedimenticolaceae bacterium]|nr:redoxin domain-containing protein [Candidatus Polarisedimenticolaceae bacterium]